MDFLASTATAVVMPAHNHPVQTLAFNRNGRVLATGDTMRTMKAWFDFVPFLDANIQSTNLKVRAIDRIRGLAFSPEGDRLYVACGDTVRAFDLARRAEIWQYQPPRHFGFLISSPVAVAVSPSGNIVTVSDTGLVAALDANGKQLGKWWDNEAPRYVSFTGDGTGIVGADGFSVSVWEPYSGKKIKRIRSRERIYGMAVDPLREVVATRTLHNVELYDAKTLEPIEKLPAPSGLPLMAFSPDGSVLALGGKEEVLLLELAERRCHIIPVQAARVVSIAYHPSGAHISAGCSDGVVRFWETTPSSRQKSFHAQSEASQAVPDRLQA